MKKTLSKLAVAAVALLTVLWFTATPAAASGPACPAGKYCTYWDTTGGAMYYYSPVPGCIEIGAPWDNNTSQHVNKSAWWVDVYPNHGCSGYHQGIAPNDYLIEGFIYNDTASSFFFVRCC